MVVTRGGERPDCSRWGSGTAYERGARAGARDARFPLPLVSLTAVFFFLNLRVLIESRVYTLFSYFPLLRSLPCPS